MQDCRYYIFWKFFVGQGHFKFLTQSKDDTASAKSLGEGDSINQVWPVYLGHLCRHLRFCYIEALEILRFDAANGPTNSFSLCHKSLCNILNQTKPLFSYLSSNILDSLLAQGHVLKLTTDGTSWDTSAAELGGTFIQPWCRDPQHPWSSAI